jgi:PIN domain nuclease of toxin-antitoxin system
MFKALLLDTHTFLWLINGDETLGSAIKDLIQETSREGHIGLSSISIWEIAMLQNKGRISLSQPIERWIDKATASPLIRVINIDKGIALESCHLPGEFHGDPADRFIVATARLLGIPLITRDKKILEYGSQDYVKTIAC